MKERIADGKERYTYLVVETAPINCSAALIEEVTYRNDKGIHTEELMLTELPRKGYQLPAKLHLSRSPCEHCAVKLIKRTNSPNL